MNKNLQILSNMGACNEGMDWVETQGERSDQEIWDACVTPSWLLWYLGQTAAAREKVVLAACACARLALPYVKGPTTLRVIETVEAWANGKATLAEVMAADADANANAAANYAARRRTDAACCAEIRKIFPVPPEKG